MHDAVRAEGRGWLALGRTGCSHGRRFGEGTRRSQGKPLPDSARESLTKLYNYLKTHEDHIHYEPFKAAGLPIGSGLVESACKWLIQQRFKGVGMRWSEPGFNHLLHLRLAWVNQRFDRLFPRILPFPN